MLNYKNIQGDIAVSLNIKSNRMYSYINESMKKI